MRVSQFDERLYRGAFRAYGLSQNTQGYATADALIGKNPATYVLRLGTPFGGSFKRIPVEREFKTGEPVVLVPTRVGVPRIEAAPEDAKTNGWLVVFRTMTCGPAGAHGYVVFPKGAVIVAVGIGDNGPKWFPERWAECLAIVPFKSVVRVHRPKYMDDYYVFHEDDVHIVRSEEGWRVYLATNDEVFEYAQPVEVWYE